jgi:hypothetical protein
LDRKAFSKSRSPAKRPDDDILVLMDSDERSRRSGRLAGWILIVNEWLPQKPPGIKGSSTGGAAGVNAAIQLRFKNRGIFLPPNGKRGRMQPSSPRNTP